MTDSNTPKPPTRSTRTVREVSLFKPKKKPKQKNTDPNAPPVFKLTFRSLSKAGFGAVFKNLGAMLIILWLPIVVSVAIAYGAPILSETVSPPLVAGVRLILHFVLFSSVAVAIFRLLLVKESPKLPGLDCSKLATTALMFNVAIWGRVLFIMALPSALLYASFWTMDAYPDLIWWRMMMSVFSFVFAVMVLLAMDVGFRLFFAVPALVLGQKSGLKTQFQDALKFGSGYVVTIITANFLVAVPFAIVTFALTFLPPSPAFGLTDVLGQVMCWVFTAIFISMFAIAHEAIEKKNAKKKNAKKSKT